ncbi:hypothetical protein Tco_0059229 [Tanacetum coccineum]
MTVTCLGTHCRIDTGQRLDNQDSSVEKRVALENGRMRAKAESQMEATRMVDFKTEPARHTLLKVIEHGEFLRNKFVTSSGGKKRWTGGEHIVAVANNVPVAGYKTKTTINLWH